ncbi:MAG TPA: RteC domain-containing protein [Puia sp.]|nr:RteC domain-containing protein [Puia sp.]
MEQQLEAVPPDINAVRGYNVKTELAEDAIRKVKEHLHQHPMTDQDMEVSYFKYWAPRFFKLQLFHTLLYNLECARITVAAEASFKEYLNNEARRIRGFQKEHEDLWVYYLLAETSRDKELFICRCPSKSEEFLTADEIYCGNSILLAKIMAYEAFLPIITRELNQMEAGKEDAVAELPEDAIEYKWIRSKADAAEIIYAWAKLKCISVGGREADIKDLAEFFKIKLGLDIGNIYDVEWHNKKRKKEKAPFLNAMACVYLDPDK